MDNQMINIEFLAEGIRRVNQAFIESDLRKDDYPPMVVQYLISALLIALGQKASDFGFSPHPDKDGYVGWLSIGSKTLLFAPTKVSILDSPAAGTEAEQVE